MQSVVKHRSSEPLLPSRPEVDVRPSRHGRLQGRSATYRSLFCPHITPSRCASCHCAPSDGASSKHICQSTGTVTRLSSFPPGLTSSAPFPWPAAIELVHIVTPTRNTHSRSQDIHLQGLALIFSIVTPWQSLAASVAATLSHMFWLAHSSYSFCTSSLATVHISKR